jgi:hypothetical protein
VSLTYSNLEDGITMWRKKTATAEWPADFHNAMYTEMDMTEQSVPFTATWWREFISPRVASWRAYRPVSCAEIDAWAKPLLDDMRVAYLEDVVPHLNTPFEELTWEKIQTLPNVVARAKRRREDLSVQTSPVFRSKVSHWIAPRLYPVSDNELLGITASYEEYWKGVHRLWCAISEAERTRKVAILHAEIEHVSRYPVLPNYPFEVKVVELALIGRRFPQHRPW